MRRIFRRHDVTCQKYGKNCRGTSRYYLHRVEPASGLLYPEGPGLPRLAADSLYLILTGFMEFLGGRHGCFQLLSCRLLKSDRLASWPEPSPRDFSIRNI